MSVISRATMNKYVTTQWGVFPLKYFFNEGLQHDSGEEVSSREIQSILKSVIAAESKSKPLSDEQLCAILRDKGYEIARRTVAKYREKLGIPVARMRREI
jgi:RNA polymerase sigma-54 factor